MSLMLSNICNTVALSLIPHKAPPRLHGSCVIIKLSNLLASWLVTEVAKLCSATQPGSSAIKRYFLRILNIANVLPPICCSVELHLPGQKQPHEKEQTRCDKCCENDLVASRARTGTGALLLVISNIRDSMIFLADTYSNWRLFLFFLNQSFYGFSNFRVFDFNEHVPFSSH
jgi:hypothetical protein